MTREGKITILNCFLFGLIIALLMGDARADSKHECQGNACNNTVVPGDLTLGDNIGGDTTIGDTILTGGAVTNDISMNPGDVNYSSKALALSNNMGDVDIAGCLGSTQWATPLFSKQKLVLNWPCMAEFYLRNNQWSKAAMAICNTAVVDEYPNEQACEDDHDFQPVIESAVIITESDDEDEERYNALSARMEAQEARTAKAESDARKVRVQPQRPPQTIIQQQAFINESKRAKLAALRGEK